MHYKNGRAAKDGDVVVSLDPHNPAIGMLYNASAASDTCNGRIARIKSSDPYVTIKECVHVDDVKAIGAPAA